MVFGLHQMDGIFVYVSSVNIINIFHRKLLIYVETFAILWDVFVGLIWYLYFEKILIFGSL